MAIRSRSATFAPVNTNQFLNALTTVTLGGLILVVLMTSSGCSVTSGLCRAVTNHDGLDKFMIGYRNRVLAARAWHERRQCYGNRRHRSDFENGFLQGYIDVANGGNGCVPAVAPASYLGWRYQTADGQAAINAWFEGYPLGAQVAEQDGVGHWGVIRPSGPRKPQQAVYVPPPPPAEEVEENPFYQQRYPVEPKLEPDDEDMDEDEEASASDDPIRKALESSLDDDPTKGSSLDDDSNPLEEASKEMSDDPPEPPADVGDAIRDALEAGLDDSTQYTPRRSNSGGYSAQLSDSNSTSDAVQQFFSDPGPQASRPNGRSELEYRFE